MPALSDEKILELLKSHELIVHPLLEKKQINGGKIDLRLDNVIFYIRRFARTYYDPLRYAVNRKEPPRSTEEYMVPYSGKFVLHPGDYALAPLFEYVRLPKYLIGRLDGRSSLGRLGVVVHSTAGSVDPDYRGPLIMELMNHGMLPVALRPLMRIATLTLISLTGEAGPYDGKYGRSHRLTVESMLHKDEDLRVMWEMKKYL